MHRADHRDAGVVAEHVRGAERVVGLARPAARRPRAGRRPPASRARPEPSAAPLGRAWRAAVRLDVGHHHLHALGGEALGEREPDPARRAGDHRDLPGEILHGFPPRPADRPDDAASSAQRRVRSSGRHRPVVRPRRDPRIERPADVRPVRRGQGHEQRDERILQLGRPAPLVGVAGRAEVERAERAGGGVALRPQRSSSPPGRRRRPPSPRRTRRARAPASRGRPPRRRPPPRSAAPGDRRSRRPRASACSARRPAPARADRSWAPRARATSRGSSTARPVAPARPPATPQGAKRSRSIPRAVTWPSGRNTCMSSRTACPPRQRPGPAESATRWKRRIRMAGTSTSRVSTGVVLRKPSEASQPSIPSSPGRAAAAADHRLDHGHVAPPRLEIRQREGDHAALPAARGRDLRGQRAGQRAQHRVVDAQHGRVADAARRGELRVHHRPDRQRHPDRPQHARVQRDARILGDEIVEQRDRHERMRAAPGRDVEGGAHLHVAAREVQVDQCRRPPSSRR